jgi:hypothetical protein
MILLNKYLIPGYEIKVSASLSIAGEDASGNGSSTTQTEKGEKAKEVSVSTHIRFVDKADLTRLIAVAEGKDSKDERKIYDIINETANALNIRQVQFQGDVQVHEEDRHRAWAITFKLVEYHSVPEKKQSASDKTKTKAKSKTTQAAAGKTAKTKKGEQTKVETATQPTAAASSTPANENPQLSSTEKVLKWIDGKLQ